MSSGGPQASASVIPCGFRVRKVERKKTPPQIAIKKHKVKIWTSGITTPAGQDFARKP